MAMSRCRRCGSITSTRYACKVCGSETHLKQHLWMSDEEAADWWYGVGHGDDFEDQIKEDGWAVLTVDDNPTPDTLRVATITETRWPAWRYRGTYVYSALWDSPPRLPRAPRSA
jgi:hypothetical protein